MWYYLDRKSPIGPFDDLETGRLIRAGTIRATTLVWREGMVGWSEAEHSEWARHWGKTYLPPGGMAVDSAVLGLPPPPPACLASSAAPRTAPLGFQDPTRLARWVIAFLLLYLCLSVVIIGAWGTQLVGVAKLAGDVAEARQVLGQAFGNIRRLVWLHVAAFLSTAILFARWTYVAAGNVRRLGAEGLEFTPGWAAGYFFVPIFNLWKPYGALNEIWKASEAPLDWRNQPDVPLLRGWWVFWVLLIVVHLAVPFNPHARTMIELLVVPLGWVLDQLLKIALSIYALLVVRRLSAAQLHTARRLAPNISGSSNQ